MKLCKYTIPHQTFNLVIYLFILVWTYVFLVYSTDHNLLLPSFIVILKLSRLTKKSLLSKLCISLMCSHNSLGSLPCFLVKDVSGSSCTFSAQVLESAISPRRLVPLVLRSQDLVLAVFTTIEVSLLLTIDSILW